MISRCPVAVVVVSYNSSTYLPDCLDSLQGLERPPGEIVVVDSGSTDGSADLVATRYPQVRLVACEDNVGFCKGNNIGIRTASSPYVLALNPDTMLEPDFIERLLPAFDDPRVGMAGGKLLRFDRETLDSAGQLLSRSRRPTDRGYGQRDRGQFDSDGEVFGICGAAALYRRRMLDAIADPGPAFFDETFFAFGEDLDVAWRAARLGWLAAYRHEAVGYHARGGTAANRSGLRARTALLGRGAEIRFHVAKNRYLTILRNDSVAGYVGNLPFVIGRDLSLLGLIVLTSPGVLVRLWRGRRVFREALRKRGLDATRARDDVQ